jgi:hypothetical protein
MQRTDAHARRPGAVLPSLAVTLALLRLQDRGWWTVAHMHVRQGTYSLALAMRLVCVPWLSHRKHSWDNPLQQIYANADQHATSPVAFPSKSCKRVSCY